MFYLSMLTLRHSRVEQLWFETLETVSQQPFSSFLMINVYFVTVESDLVL